MSEALGVRGSVYILDPDSIVIIGVDTNDGPEHPLYDERIKWPLDEKMVLNIMEFGVMEPVLARRNGALAEVIDGRRRVLHAREANKRLTKSGREPIGVSLHMKRGDEKHLVGMSISANEIRSDDSPMAKARKTARYMEMGHSEAQAALIFGVDEITIKGWMKLMDLAPAVQKLVDQGVVSASAAAKLANLSHDDQKKQIEELLKSGKKVTAKKVERKKKQKSGDDEAYEAPGRRVIRKVLERNETAQLLSEDFVRALRWTIGKMPETHIKGLRSLMDDEKDEAAE